MEGRALVNFLGLGKRQIIIDKRLDAQDVEASASTIAVANGGLASLNDRASALAHLFPWL